MIPNPYIEPFYLSVFSLTILLITYLFWSINNDIKKLKDYIEKQQFVIDTHAHAIGELQRQVQRVISTQKEE